MGESPRADADLVERDADLRHPAAAGHHLSDDHGAGGPDAPGLRDLVGGRQRELPPGLRQHEQQHPHRLGPILGKQRARARLRAIVDPGEHRHPVGHRLRHQRQPFAEPRQQRRLPLGRGARDRPCPGTCPLVRRRRGHVRVLSRLPGAAPGRHRSGPEHLRPQGRGSRPRPRPRSRPRSRPRPRPQSRPQSRPAGLDQPGRPHRRLRISHPLGHGEPEPRPQRLLPVHSEARADGPVRASQPERGCGSVPGECIPHRDRPIGQFRPERGRHRTQAFGRHLLHPRRRLLERNHRIPAPLPRGGWGGSRGDARDGAEPRQPEPRDGFPKPPRHREPHLQRHGLLPVHP